ncbi:hypothetical protein HFRIS_004998 [Herbaspirillum frisingense GSF30]|uniref:Uncharacterized protein n=1 Tax=Herbaspirillum frisingense GSF30 TaxID=864073 RepID=A0AAI9IHB8_9BURK|nr:hypothetical protein [Herbaspirillum frisingense]EOA05788.1 hypothetical protein HFRIS_004998 [Herbaspirillum frisingense GSF30]
MSEKQYSVTLTEKQLEAVEIALHVRIDQCRSNYAFPCFAFNAASHAEHKKYWSSRQLEAESAMRQIEQAGYKLHQQMASA